MSGKGFLVMDPSPLREEPRRALRPVNAAYFEVSPSHKPSKAAVEVKEEVSVLRLVHFTHSPKIDFDKVKLGTQRKRILRVLNPKDVTQEVVCEKLPSEESGFTLSITQLTLAPAESFDVEILWHPTKHGPSRETLHWRSSAGVRAQTTIFGNCPEPPKKKKGRPAPRAPLQNHNSTTNIRPAKAKVTPKPARKVTVNNENIAPGSRVAQARISKPQQPAKLTTFALTVQPQSFNFSENMNITQEIPVRRNNGRRHVHATSDFQSSQGLRESLGYFEGSDDRVAKSEEIQQFEECHVESSESFYTKEVVNAREYDYIDMSSRDIVSQVKSGKKECVTSTVNTTSNTSRLVTNKKGGAKKHVMWKDDSSYRENCCEEVLTESYTYTQETYEEVFHETEVVTEEIGYKFESAEPSFRKVIGNRLPECTAESSPARRQTYVKEEDVEYFSLKERGRRSCPGAVESPKAPQRRARDPEFRSVASENMSALVSDSPARRETYTAETFESIDEGKHLPHCSIEGSPVRRETFIKDKSDSMRRSTLTLGVKPHTSRKTSVPEVVLEEVFTPPAIRANSCVHDKTTPDTPVARNLALGNLTALAASCRDLLNQIDIDSPNSTATNISFNSERKLSDISTPNNITEKLTPKEVDIASPLQLSRCKKELDSSLNLSACNTRCLSPLVGRNNSFSGVGSEAHPALMMSPSATPSLRRISEASVASPTYENNKQFIQNQLERLDMSDDTHINAKVYATDAIEDADISQGTAVTVPSEQFSDSLENRLDDDVVESFDENKVSEELHDKSNVSTEIPESNLEDSFRRLSTDTVTKETSILLPEDIVNLDEVQEEDITSGNVADESQIKSQRGKRYSVGDTVCYTSSEYYRRRSLVNNKVSQICEHDGEDTAHPNNTYLPKISKPDIESPWADEEIDLSAELPDQAVPRRGSFVVPASSVSSAITRPVLPPALESHFAPAINKPNRQLPPATTTSHLTPSDQSFMCASLSEFSFHPSNDPRRCSTGVKTAPPVDVVTARNLEGGKRLFTGPEYDQVDSGKLSSDNTFVALASPLSTIVENEEKPLAAPQSKNSTFDKSQPSEGTQIVAVDSNIVEYVTSKQGLQFIEISPPNKRRALSPATKQPGWSKTKRTRYEPRPSVRVGVTALKLQSERRPPPGKAAGVVSSKCKSPAASAVRATRPPPVPTAAKSTRSLASKFATPKVPVKQPLKKAASSSSVLVDSMLSFSSIAPSATFASKESRTASKEKSAPSTLIPTDNTTATFSRPKTSGPAKLSQRRSIATSNDPVTVPRQPFLRRGNSHLNLRTSGPVSQDTITSVISDSSSTSGDASNSRSSLRVGGGLKKSLSMRSIPIKMSTKSMKMTSLAHHPNPFVADNMFYDNRWVEKQTAGFSRWLNFVLTPPDEENTATSSKVEIKGLWAAAVRGGGNVQEHRAPTKEVLSLKTYTARGRLNRLRRAACRLFQSSDVCQVVAKLEVAIDKKLIVMRKDRHIHMDVGQKQHFVQLLLCYNPLWLRLGLETVFGELLLLQSNADVTAITRYIIFRLLSNTELQRRYAHPTVPHSYRPGYEEAVQMFLNKKFLILVFFLDAAKNNKLIDHDPCLFRKDAHLKSSRDVLLEYARDFLSGVGDLTKHLGYLGYTVSHQQTSLDEFDYAVTNLAIDLRCGIRLARIGEILSGSVVGCLSKQLRVPAVSRLQKVHNITLAMHKLQLTQQQGGLDLCKTFPPPDVVAGHREHTLGLLWALISNAQLLKVINLGRLRDEVQYLRRSLSVRAQFSEVAGGGREELVSLLAEEQQQTEGRNVVQEDGDGPDTVILLLKRWVQYICAHYGVMVYNLTASMSDGRALCHVLQHYHPDLLPLQQINNSTTHTMQLSQGVDLDVSADDSFSSLACADDDNQQERQQRLANERANHSLFTDKLCSLGGVPLLVRSQELVNTIPDEKVMVTFLAHLCGRLLDLSEEIKAARVIQMAWRKRMLVKQQQRLEVETRASVTIQRWWRNVLHRLHHVAYTSAALVLQKHWRRVTAQRLFYRMKNKKTLEKQEFAARVIQSTWRRYLVAKYVTQYKATVTIQRCWLTYRQRTKFLQSKAAAVKIQAAFRGYRARKECKLQVQRIVKCQSYVRRMLTQHRYVKLRRTAVDLQRRWRRKNETKQVREQYLQLRSVIIIIQSFVRGVVQRQRYIRTKEAAILIQSRFRGLKQRREYTSLKNATSLVQTRWRNDRKAQLKRKEYLEMKSSAVIIQSAWRSYRAHTHYLRQRGAVAIISSSWKMYRARKAYLQLKHSTITVQRLFRNRCLTQRLSDNFKKLKHSTIMIQSLWRMSFQRNKYLRYQSAVVTIQRWFIANKERKDFLRKKSAAAVIQNRFRAYAAMKEERALYIAMTTSAITIQRYFRGYNERKKYTCCMRSIVLIQKHMRGYLARNNFNKQLLSAKILQTRFRAWLLAKKTREAFLEQKSSAIIIQKIWRCYACLQKYVQQRNAAIIIQKTYRMFIKKRNFVRTKVAVSLIQERFRSYLLSRKIRQDFINQKRACVAIQSRVRGFLCRKSYNRLREAAITIQNRYRACVLSKVTRKQYLQSVSSIITVQSCVRSYLARRTYIRKRAAIILLQSRLRATLLMAKQRKDYVSLIRSTILVQSLVRMRAARSKYYRQRSAVCSLQVHTRAWILGKQERRRFLNQRSAAITLQKHYRGYICRKNLSALNSAATVIQCNYRKFKQQKDFSNMKKAAVIIQSWVRKVHAQREYRRKCSAIRSIQVHFKSLLLMQEKRFEFTSKKSAAVKIQSAWRSYAARKRYVYMIANIIKIQRFVRAVRLGRSQQQTFQNMKNAALIIQKNYRFSICRRDFLQKRAAAIVIQKNIRKFLARKSYLNTLSAVVCIQRTYRSIILMQSSRQIYLAQRSASIILQKNWRMTLCRRQFLHERRACVTIQKNIRMYHTRKYYQKKHSAAIILQRWYRSRQLTKATKQSFQVQKFAVVLLQKNWRMFWQRRLYLSQRKSVIIIQRRYREYLLSRRNRNEYLELKSAAVVLQSHVRLYTVRRKYKNIRAAAITLQQRFRAQQMMLTTRTQFITMQSSVRLIQQWYRGALLTRSVRLEFEAKRCAAVTLQAAFRGWKVRRDMRKLQFAALRVQMFWRRCCVAKKCIISLQAAVKIQRWYRSSLEGRKCRQQYLTMRQAAVTIQKSVRRYQDRTSFLKLRTATVTLQSYYRMRLDRYSFNELKHSTICIQQFYRNHKETQKIRSRFLSIKSSIIALQAISRGALCRRKFQQKREAAIIIQKHYRRVMQVRAYRKILAEEVKTREEAIRNTSAVAIQRHVRGFLQRRSFKHTLCSVITIQSHIRCLRERRSFLEKRRAVIVLQKRYREVLAMRVCHKEFLSKKAAAVTLQSAWRGVVARKHYKLLLFKSNMATIIIQRAYRARLAQLAAQRREAAVVTLQRHWRGAIDTLRQREHFIYMRRAAVILQTAWRARTARLLLHREKAARTIQCYYRGYLVRKNIAEQLAEHRLRLTERYTLAATKIQRWWRLHAVLRLGRENIKRVLLLQRMWRKVITIRRLEEKQTRAAIIIQSLWRGYRVRHIPVGLAPSAAMRLLEPQRKRLTLVRKRLDANAGTQKPIGVKTQQAILILLKYKDLKMILRAVIALEASTRWSSICCFNVVSEGTLAHLMSLVNVCNRSLPYMQILLCILNIFLNLVKCEETFDSVANMPDFVEVMVKLISIYHEKHTLLFTKSCTLLYLVCKHQKEVIVSDAAKKDTANIYSVMLRKASARERGKRFIKPNIIPERRCPALVPHYALSNTALYEFEDALPAAVTLLTLWGVKT